MKQTTLHVPTGVDDVIEGLVAESHRTGEVPSLTQADVSRLLLRDACHRLVEGDLLVHEDVQEEIEIEGETLSELIPKDRLGKFLYQQRKDENWLADMKGGFEGRVRDNFEKRYKNGYDPDAIENLANGYIEEARDWWLRLEDDPEKFAEKRDHVLDLVEEFRARADEDETDPNDDFLKGVTRSNPHKRTDERESGSEPDRDQSPDRREEDLETARERVRQLLSQDAPGHKIAQTVVQETPATVSRTDVHELIREEREEDDEDLAPDGSGELMTDGGRDQDQPMAVSENYWDDLESDGGQDENQPADDDTQSMTSTQDLIEEACDEDDELHSIMPTQRDGDVLLAWTVREQPAKSGSGSVFHLRLIRVDQDDMVAQWTDYGVIIQRTDLAASAFVKAFARARDGGEDPGVFNAMAGGNDDLAREILSEEVESESEPGEVVDHSDESVESGSGAYVECEDCGQTIPKDEAENFGGGLIDAWVHSGPCPTGETDE